MDSGYVFVCACVFVNLFAADLEMPLVANAVANG